MRVRISRDARPQATTLLVAAAISIALWFIPFAELLNYPFRLFVTFIHEGGHALAALLTGNSVRSLRDRKSTRLNSSHVRISYSVLCLEKKKKLSTDRKLLTDN